MKTIIAFILGIQSFYVYAAKNTADSVDENLVPASKEERMYEDKNRRDKVDLNTTPSSMERRQEEEYLDTGSDVIDRDAEDDSDWD